MVIREAVGDRHQKVHEANLFDLQAKYAEVVSETQVLEYVAGLPDAKKSGAPEQVGADDGDS